MTAQRPSVREEQALQAQGFGAVAGVDEAGRGAWAGPVFAAAVIMPVDARISAALAGVNDSKKLSVAQRVRMRALISEVSVAWSVGVSSNGEIDALGILPATRLAMMRAVAALRVAPDALLIDAVKLPALALQQKSFNFADSISLSVAAASILAKTSRDALMVELDEHVPGFGFGVHKGYGTRLHQLALAAHGVTWLHRRTFRPIRALLCESQGGAAPEGAAPEGGPAIRASQASAVNFDQ